MVSSPPPSRSTFRRSRRPISRLCTSAIFLPSRSIAIVSRMWSLRSWILATSAPAMSCRMNVSRRRMALPSTLYTLSPCSSVIHESSPIDASFSRIWYFTASRAEDLRLRRSELLVGERARVVQLRQLLDLLERIVACRRVGLGVALLDRRDLLLRVLRILVGVAVRLAA